MGKLSHKIFSLSLEEVTFARRGFRGADPATQRYLERVGATFLSGYHAALAHDIQRLQLKRLLLKTPLV